MAAPVINSALNKGGNVGSAFSYTITATNTPTSFGASATAGLPAWMAFDPTTGIMSGTPDVAGTLQIKMTATNASGQGKANLYLHIVPAGAPVITSATTATATVGVSFTYTIVGTNTPTSFNTIGALPSGVTLNTTTGAITGTPTVAGVYTPSIYAANASGNDHLQFTITVNSGGSAPVINSSLNIAATIGLPLSYNITGTNTPTSYNAISLPTGLGVNTVTGVISGTVLTAGVYTPSISATNASGTGNAVLTITISPSTSLVCPTGISWLNAQSAEIPGGAINNSLVDIISFGTSWSEIQPSSSSSYDWSYLTRNIQLAAAANKFLLVRLGTGSGFAAKGGRLPNWLATLMGLDPASNEIVPGVSYTYNKDPGNPMTLVITIPVFWHPVYVAQKIIFYQALGDYLTNSPDLTPFEKSKVKIVAGSFCNATTEDWSIPNSTMIESVGGPDGTGYTMSEVNRWLTPTSDPDPGAGYDSVTLLNAGKQILDALLDSCPNQFVSLAIAGNGPTLDIDIGGADPANWMAKAILDYQLVSHTDRLICQRQSVASSQQAAPPPAATVWKPLYDYGQAGHPVAGQMLWFVYPDDMQLRVNGGTRDDPDGIIPNPPGLTDQQILNQSGQRAHSYGMKYLEVYKGDIGTPQDITPTRDLLYVVPAGGIAPIITSGNKVTGSAGTPLTYQITADNLPTAFGASGLPDGLVVNTVTGLIDGIPTTAATYPVTVTASNTEGTGQLVVQFKINPGTGGTGSPVITSPLVATAVTAVPFTYQIEATNAPTSYRAIGGPMALLIDQATGIISGTLGSVASYTITIRAYNAAGFGEAQLTVNVVSDLNGFPVITNLDRYTPVMGTPYTLQIEGTNSPESYLATTLPDGLGVNVVTGLISGTPTLARTFTSTLSATNAVGTGSKEVTFAVGLPTVVPPPSTVKSYAFPEIPVFSEDTIVIATDDGGGSITEPPPATEPPTAPHNLVVTTPQTLNSGRATATWDPPSNIE